MAYDYSNTEDESDEGEKPKYVPPDIPEGMDEALPDLIDDAISFMEAAFEKEQEEMTDYYKGELPSVEQQDVDDGRSDIVSRDVHDAVQAAMPDLVRIFLGPEHVVNFEPSSQDTNDRAEEVTELIRWIFEKENDAFAIVHGALKDGLVRAFAVAVWWHEIRDKSFNKDYTLDEDTLAQMLEDENTSVVTSRSLKAKDPETGRGLVECTLRHEVQDQEYHVELVPPEEVIVSRKARDTSGRWLVGRRQNKSVAELVGMGYDEGLVEAHATSDSTIETSQQAQSRAPDGTATSPGQEDASERTEEGKEALYCEVYVEWPLEDRMCLYKVCTLGNTHEIVACEEVQNVDMALWTPDPEPHTVIGEAWAHKVKDIQRLKTGVWRGVMDSLAEALVPRMEVVETQTNIEDALSTEIGGLIRVRQPNMVRPVSQPFLGQQAMPLLDAVDSMREERVGAFRAADGLSAEAMQSSTKMAVAATISGSKAQKELLARVFAWTFLRPLFRGLLRLVVRHQDKPKTIRVNGRWVDVDPRDWNADMDCTVDVGPASMTNEERLQVLGGIAEKQEQILQTMGPLNPLANLGHYAYTLRKMTALSGYHRMADRFFGNLPTDPVVLAQVLAQVSKLMPAQPDPATMLAQQQVRSLQMDDKRKDAKAAHDASIEADKLEREDDFRRDQLAQQREVDLFKVAAQFGVDAHEIDARITAEQQARRDEQGNAQHLQTMQHVSDHVSQAAQHAHDAQQSQADREAGFVTQGAQLDAQQQDADAQREFDASQGDAQRQFDASQSDADRALQDKQHQRDTKAAAANANADRKAKAKAKPNGPRKK